MPDGLGEEMTEYKAGDVVNGHVWTGHSWVPVSDGRAVVPPPVGAPTPAPVPARPPRTREAIRRENVRNGFGTVVGLAWIVTVFAFATGWIDRTGAAWQNAPKPDALQAALGDFTRGLGIATAPLAQWRWLLLGVSVALTIALVVVLSRMPKGPATDETPDPDATQT